VHWIVALGANAPLNVVVTIALALGAFAVGYRGGSFETWLTGRNAIFHALPRGVQVLVALVVVDFAGYWIHRTQHGALWRFHAIHHSSTRLDWLAAARNHPIGELFGRVCAVPLFLMGMDVRVLAVIAPVAGLWGVFLHANVPWRFGALRYVIATPLFHRWHHASEPEAHDKNFAGLFPIWDILFGTFYMPDRQPTSFGAAGEAVPEAFFAQLAYPFRRRTR
jgi:sterol desaturase/sphingolipid hydroxylase (fatty acid hydroxylase superfamily)